MTLIPKQPLNIKKCHIPQPTIFLTFIIYINTLPLDQFSTEEISFGWIRINFGFKLWVVKLKWQKCFVPNSDRSTKDYLEKNSNADQNYSRLISNFFSHTNCLKERRWLTHSQGLEVRWKRIYRSCKRASTAHCIS